MRQNIALHVNKKHPLVLQEYAVFTPPIDDLARTLGDWINQQLPGGYVYGPSRFGKSRGVKWHIRSILEERFGQRVPLHIWIRPPDIQTSESGFIRSLLSAFGYLFPQQRQTKSAGRDALIELLMASAHACDTNFIVIIIDEAQAMTLKEWSWMLGIQNALDWHGYRLSVFSIASHQMGYEYELMGRAGFAHLAARFMVARWAFPGLTSEEELAYVLDGYDESSEWPAGSGQSYLAHFAPTYYRRGERLAECAGVFWRVLDEMLPASYRGEANLPMQHVAYAIEGVLFRLASGDDWDKATSPNTWIDELERSGFTDHMRLITASMPQKVRQSARA